MWSAWSVAVVLVGSCAAYVAGVVAPALARGASPWPYVAAVPLVYLGVLGIFVAFYFVLAWIHRAPRPPGARIGAGATVRLVATEYWTLAGDMFRILLYRVWVPDPKPMPARLPVLLVHGVLCNAGVWSTFVRWWRREGVESVYAPSYGPPLGSIDAFADQVHACIERMCAETGAAQVFVATHSMGGLVMLAYLRRHGAARVRRLVTIAAPFRGSMHAWAFFGTSLSQLRPGNAWLGALDVLAPREAPPIVSIWSRHDSMVAPQDSSELPGATNIPLTGIGHNALLHAPQVFDLVLKEYRVALDAGATSGSPASAARTPSAPA
jgi:pimeloyl-ACP methyl ester carboxylesterase